MEAVWVDTSPHAVFWRRLHNEVVDKLVSDPDQFLLRRMRYDHDMVREYQRRFGSIFAERGLNLYELIARACGEVWDDEDEEKGGHLRRKNLAPMEVKEKPNALRVDRPRQERVREREEQGDVVQSCDDRREEDLQAQSRRFFGGLRSRSPQKAPP